ncbi:MAG TPA: NADP(H)-dependent aldo-keto reductase [Nevskiaceae bacterium]|nr:NADP(H)-dependent aldo-keto reductase [Nevskiaceae bacterium]
MKRRPLGDSGLEVSLIGLGTMTWGEQNDEAEAHAQIDLALDHGVTLLDAAEMYPVPPRAETQGLTERYIGSWLRRRGRRSEVLIATKVTGPGDFPYLRGGSRLDRASVLAACEGSLTRLGCEVIDLYQVHWPQRPTNYFGRLGYSGDGSDGGVPIEETLRALDQLQREGKIRAVGLSNETPWGLAEYLRLAREHGLPRVVSVQNPYSLLNRSYEIGLAEYAAREGIGLLAYSPLAMGALSGKYRDGVRPEGARLTRYSRFTRYLGAHADAAVAAYVDLAQSHGLDPAQMALAYVNSRPFLTSTLIGATTLAQLRRNLESAALSLSSEVLAAIEAIHRRYTIPCP